MPLKGHLTLAAVCLALAGCQGSTKSADVDAAMFSDNQGLLTVPPASPLRSHLVVQAVGADGAARMIDLPASVEADPARVANILTPLTGRVAALKVALGQHVKRGQVLAIIASGDLAQAYDDDDKARDALDLAARTLERARGVREAGGAANKDLEAAQSAYNQAEAEQTRTRVRLNSLNGANAGHIRELVLTAPQSGVVTTLSIASGVQVSDPTAVLMTVTNVDRVFVTANVAESDIGRIGLGAAADIVLTAFPGQNLHGRVAEVNAVVEPDTRRQKVRIALPNEDGRLMPNMYATVRIAAPSAGGVFVPQSALLMNNDSTSVLVEIRPWVFQRRAVQLGDENDVSARVLSGLAAGERVVVKGGVLLND
jgi:cobalt-zinc-cadmium efflux system membrane fusion protein